ncbi:hypothetical protein FA13DRAFT_1717708 [Coprinellus micaceus]|uniref:Uncharacterized protein n=1 Tax=Coprinellus micaceus TaxID=71717 RepID=A0A4Y7SF59_COPMI|nr:hypothetical protein FA13DRAFT_1717708 [Coprinellus micaceus]
MKFLPFSLRSKHAVPPADVGTTVNALQAPPGIGEFGELSWYQAPLLEEYYDGGLFLRTLSDCHNQDPPVATGSKYRGGSLSISAGSEDHPIDLTSETPRMAYMEPVSLASRSGCSVISSESAPSTFNLSAYSSSFPVVPPVSDQMIEALSLGLERDYHEALILSSASSSSSFR